jgi:hypothetical protein
MTNVMKLALPIAIAATGCIPVHDYEGEYEMTYDVIMTFADGSHRDARAGLAEVEVRHGLNTEYLIDLGASFCRLEGTSVEAKLADEWPYLDIRPQDCWFTSGEKTYPMSVTGTATFGERDERLTIVLTGSFVDDVNETRGSATIELTESW